MKVGIVGSEATRGIFLFNSIGTALYKTGLISYQTTSMSNVSPPIEKSIDLSSLSAWDIKMVENNLYKVWVKRLKDFSPSVVVIDFVSDVMYSSVEYESSWITKNPIILKNLKKNIVDQGAIHADEEAFFQAWLVSAECLIKTVRDTCPEALIILHSAQLLNTFIDKEGFPRKARNDDVSSKNDLLKKMNIAAECWVDVVIKSDPLKFHGHELHPWGLGVAKYETKYNTFMLGLFATKILENKLGEIK